MEQFLIAHKVRGEPAFDVAIKIQIGKEEGWIIPTSGHRAYPAYWFKLDDLFDGSDYPHERPSDLIESGMIQDAIAQLPDHYQTVAEKGRGSGTNGRDLLEMIGLVKPREPMTRRSF